jgi:cysteine-rich repeat protein
VYVIVDGYEQSAEGSYVLGVASGRIVCGDGNRDPGEDCDDRNTQTGDGCGASCALESSESASNESTGTADAYSAPGYFGRIEPAGDVDVVQVVVSTSASSITATVNDFSDQACRLDMMDPMVEVLAPNGLTMLASNDDRSAGDLCSAATAQNLVPGTYFVRVSAGNGGRIPTFTYHLDVAVVGP